MIPHPSRPMLVLHVSFVGTFLCLLVARCSGSHSPGSNLKPLPSRAVASLHNVRGGTSPIELNPGYTGETVGDLEAKYRQNQLQRRSAYGASASSSYNGGRPKPLPQAIKDFFTALKATSPTLYFGLISILSTFMAWQIPALQRTMQTHFICSKYNIKRGRYHTILTSAMSHVSLMHLLINCYALYSFGPQVRQSIASFGLPLWPFALGSALTGSLFYLFLTRDGRGCLGSSAITVALMAFFARTYPNAQLGFIVGFIPIRLPAEYALFAIGLVSLFGSLVSGLRDNVAHSAHLGGLVFGVIYFELLIRGYLSKIGRRGR
uniref:Peptidase S54 rhomboid domain-containing protein n=1 Tax=Minutocellus polymorphus TaxID=265543 RepID=A0A6U0IQP7_9STRA|mmetsp:Transcript_14364/g.23956  ORF Transcript_14364/g.23956 Transcript_14364/m.23956 type:complete len:320 (+) Transcript_14364:72-1031(+)